MAEVVLSVSASAVKEMSEGVWYDYTPIKGLRFKIAKNRNPRHIKMLEYWKKELNPRNKQKLDINLELGIRSLIGTVLLDWQGVGSEESMEAVEFDPNWRTDSGNNLAFLMLRSNEEIFDWIVIKSREQADDDDEQAEDLGKD